MKQDEDGARANLTVSVFILGHFEDSVALATSVDPVTRSPRSAETKRSPCGSNHGRQPTMARRPRPPCQPLSTFRAAKTSCSISKMRNRGPSARRQISRPTGGPLQDTTRQRSARRATQLDAFDGTRVRGRQSRRPRLLCSVFPSEWPKVERSHVGSSTNLEAEDTHVSQTTFLTPSPTAPRRL